MLSTPDFLWKNLFKRKDPEQITVLDTLKGNILFCTLSNSELQYLSTLVYERIYQPDEPVFYENNRGMGMYLIAKGRVAIKTQSSEEEVMITTLEEGDFFGELALVDPNNIRSASAISLERSTLIGFFKPDLLEILERKPAMGVKILLQLSMVLGRRLAESLEKITVISRSRGMPHSHETNF